ncbi:ribosomal protein L6 [Gluconacetobacter diazotrophicus PA1 5]|uniref:Large ribosomal subunit protein uL6 n=1 Tax=Gluconacetobacter diazotrophicus (strain ATCC 49037 / DSM 5601 / CCUG 37298 / CIP 103539 / LMG 7603 / PAl5) TaxID=272568 RepID=RL6_GLUDA|nr:50S ribosomal protein L6 [Gluconacetobacter diazotrophicus]A9H3L8.1 RecName: Full=Large ribosomal subunit protein uL6; AltName: Full=50S ribosomal protein L6 [Gluconacetobacter diazotrophicus PA1 5]ACI52711.1 ribosomal protein L6 [Gluconacetobacter diazotrophicus PA1 5]TWB06165.1 large subunit ribosomal protein L6 [Gluconacetobacter diazotrophicus]CAP57332.1 50S ribosomal protein L6 [Gluconacetobacter diazotrophicus PA1 5]
MSRVGKYPVEVPSGVQVSIVDGIFVAKGKLGELKLPLSQHIEAEIADNKVSVRPVGTAAPARMMWGTTRALVASMVKGVSEGFSKTLEVTGTGYRAAVQGSNLVMNLGYSHDIVYAIPAGIKITTPRPTAIVVEGVDKQRVGQVALDIRSFRKPEPYKGKGVRYDTETIRRKEGKKK